MKPLIFQQPIFNSLKVALFGRQGFPSKLVVLFLLDLTLLFSLFTFLRLVLIFYCLNYKIVQLIFSNCFHGKRPLWELKLVKREENINLCCN